MLKPGKIEARDRAKSLRDKFLVYTVACRFCKHKQRKDEKKPTKHIHFPGFTASSSNPCHFYIPYKREGKKELERMKCTERKVGRGSSLDFVGDVNGVSEKVESFCEA